MGELISVDTAIKVLERILDNLSDLQNRDLNKLLMLIRARFLRYTLPIQMVEADQITEELDDLLQQITPERICHAVAMDELGAWCRTTRNEILLAIAGMKLEEE